MHINLLPLACRRRMFARQCVNRWAWRGGACLLVCTAYLIAEYRQTVAAQLGRDKVETACQSVRAIVAESKKVEDQLNNVLAQHKALQLLKPNNKPLAVLALVAQTHQGLQGKLQIQRIDFQQTLDLPSTENHSPSATVTRESGRLILEGIAIDNLAVAAFVEALRELQVIRRVELQSSTTWEGVGQAGRRFEVVCSF